MDGRLTVITGPMFAGKTTSLIKTVESVRANGGDPIVFKPAIDKRSGWFRISTHDGLSASAIELDSGKPEEIVDHVAAIEKLRTYDAKTTILVDEAQFFAKGKLWPVVRIMMINGYDVYVAGLKADYQNLPFGDMPELLAMADDIYMLYAICAHTGQVASRTQRLVNDQPAPKGEQIVVGGAERYEPRNHAAHYHPEAKRADA